LSASPSRAIFRPQMCIDPRAFATIPSPSCIFAWEQWEQWEHRINRGFPPSHSAFYRWEQWEQKPWKWPFSAHFRASKPTIREKLRAPNVQHGKNADAPFGACLQFAARKGFMPRPHAGGPTGHFLARTHNGPCTRMHARAWPVGGGGALHVQGEQRRGYVIAA
jgi:hypothetical protein